LSEHKTGNFNNNNISKHVTQWYLWDNFSYVYRVLIANYYKYCDFGIYGPFNVTKITYFWYTRGKPFYIILLIVVSNTRAYINNVYRSAPDDSSTIDTRQNQTSAQSNNCFEFQSPVDMYRTARIPNCPKYGFPGSVTIRSEFKHNAFRIQVNYYEFIFQTRRFVSL